MCEEHFLLSLLVRHERVRFCLVRHERVKMVDELSEGDTALICAVDFGIESIANTLITAGANLDLRNK